MSEKYDRIPQWGIQEDLNGITENAVFPEHLVEGYYQPRTLIDETLETIDPTPNVHTMFIQFNEKFFWNKLLPVQVRWSQRMTTCAGVCTFHPQNRECIIALSAPLLKLRPRKDLVETLLHEMIHGYLFLTNNNRDRDGHGPEFCKHMIRINKSAGTKITIYHDFHDEVRLYQQHWWRCNGPCQKRAPYFGTVRRAMNRAPGPSDFWFESHRVNCGGEFIKIREPESKAKNRSKGKEIVKSPKPNNTMDRYISSGNLKNSSPTNMMKPPSSSNVPKMNTALNRANRLSSGDAGSSSKSNSNGCPCSGKKKATSGGIATLGTVTNTGSSSKSNNNGCPCSAKSKTPSGGITKLGSGTNNVHGFGTGGPGSSTSKTRNNDASPKSDPPGKVNFSGVVGGKATGRSNLLDKFLSSPAKQVANEPKTTTKTSVQCPVCNVNFSDELINSHIDICLAKKDGKQDPPAKRAKLSNTSDTNERANQVNREDSGNLHMCPICHKRFPDDMINIHVDECLLKQNRADSTKTNDRTDQNRATNTNNPNISAALHECPVCSDFFVEDEIFDHVNRCLVDGDSKRKKSKQKKDAIIDLSASPMNDKTDRNYIKCPTCSQNIREVDYIIHVETCLAIEHSRANMKKDTVVILDDDIEKPGCSKQNSDSNGTYRCLVCDAMISKSIPLNEHLDYCVSITYRDETIAETSDMHKRPSVNIDISEESEEEEERHLCPICMKMIEDKLMAQHVDQCITSIH